jgi:adenylate cyclase
VAMSCGACGAELRDGARFCDACGSPVAAMDSHAEYKQVTVLFADVVHSMDIAATLGAERLREVMAELFNRSSKVVQRYGGTVDKFTGDGIMAVFGAPIALEDHAVRACRAALDIHRDVKHLATALENSDGVKLQLRIGLNSGEVIAGEIGSGPVGYTAIGEQVGMAQRMESVATPGGVMISESTARLVENAAILGEVELVSIKGADHPVPARRLLAVSTGRGPNRVETSFVGRQWEMGALRGLLDRAVNGNGCVVGVVGPPGIGKSRIVREIASRATDAGFETFTTYCESHTTDVPFHAAAGLVRAITGSNSLDGAAARTQVRARFSGADDEDLLILEDLLGIGDPAATLPQIDPDARRRRLAAMVNAAALTRSMPTVYFIEDAHWIDGISESMLADFLSVVPRTRSLVMITYRPEYVGALAHAPRSQTIALEPLDDSQMSQLSTELLGNDGSVNGLADLVAERAAGNPFFAEEIVRDLTERDVLIGGRGCYLCVEPATNVSVPSTVQAVIAARIDRLDPAAKRTLNAAAVIGSQFNPETLGALEIEPVLHDLVLAELIDQTVFGSRPQYAFRHALLRAVAYESQLKSDRAQLHRRFAASLEQDDANAALIAEHLESAGDSRAAYAWHMRAGEWSRVRDVSAARTSWERARQVADALSADDPERLAMQIAPRMILCATSYRSAASMSDSGFEELRELCAAAGDKRSLAMGMYGQMTEIMAKARAREASQLATEYEQLLESIGDPEFTLGLSFGPMVIKQESGEFADILRWSQMAIDLADGNPTKADFFVMSPLAVALVFRGFARAVLGLPGWREDFNDGLAMAHEKDPPGFATSVSYKYGAVLQHGLHVIDDFAIGEMEEALQIALDFGDYHALGLIKYVLGCALVESRADIGRGMQLLAEIREMCERGQFFRTELPVIDVLTGREMALNGDAEAALPTMREAVDRLFENGQLGFCIYAIKLLVGVLLDRGGEGDVREAESAIERLAAAPIADLVVRDLTELQLRALVANARGDEANYRDFRDRYRAMANDLGFEGHMAWAAAMA